MTKQHIFLKEDVTNEQFSNHLLSYRFDAKRENLTLYYEGIKCFECQAKAGQFFIAKVKGLQSYAKKVTLPQGKKNVTKYLLSSKKKDLFNSWDEIQDEPTLIKSQNVVLTDSGKLWVGDFITSNEVLNLLQVYGKTFGIQFPKHYVKSVLRAKFGIKGVDIDKLKCWNSNS